MYKPRKIESRQAWIDADGIKLYTIAAHGGVVEHADYLVQLAEVKVARGIDWKTTPAFAIFHDGADMDYLILAWWGNGNELFTSVSVKQQNGWVEDLARYSFCLWDMEVFWFERNAFIDCLYSGQRDLERYRAARYSPD